MSPATRSSFEIDGLSTNACIPRLQPATLLEHGNEERERRGPQSADPGNDGDRPGVEIVADRHRSGRPHPRDTRQRAARGDRPRSARAGRDHRGQLPRRRERDPARIPWHGPRARAHGVSRVLRRHGRSDRGDLRAARRLRERRHPAEHHAVLHDRAGRRSGGRAAPRCGLHAGYRRLATRNGRRKKAPSSRRSPATSRSRPTSSSRA